MIIHSRTSVEPALPAGAAVSTSLRVRCSDRAVARWYRLAAAVVLLVGFTGCSESTAPGRLLDWGQLSIEDRSLRPAPPASAFEISSPLFTDYAAKLRTRSVPGETRRVGDRYDYPDGTVFTKSFYYAVEGDRLAVVESEGFEIDLDRHRLIETRVLAKRDGRWAAFPYVWNEAQTDAIYAPTGAALELGLSGTSFTYFVPDENQCRGCHAWNHTDGAIRPLGAKPSQFADLPRWDDPSVPVAARARAYLDVSCAHCHNEDGAADTSGLHLGYDNTDPTSLGICKPPVAAGRGAKHRFGIVPGDPDRSIFVARLASTNPAIMMPELGRSLVHAEGLMLIRDWIAGLPGECETRTPLF